MKYLLDVNALLALALDEHEFHNPVAAWINQLAESGIPELATCAITELGFVRILGQAQKYRLNVKQARVLLMELKRDSQVRFSFLPDARDISQLPKWVFSSKQVTDGHLAELAASNGWALATLDRGIPSAFVIPL
jgi:uncharacterized protein